MNLTVEDYNYIFGIFWKGVVAVWLIILSVAGRVVKKYVSELDVAVQKIRQLEYDKTDKTTCADCANKVSGTIKDIHIEIQKLNETKMNRAEFTDAITDLKENIALSAKDNKDNFDRLYAQFSNLLLAVAKK